MEVSNRILSDITVYMKFAKYLPELNRRESWEDLVTRNKNMHIKLSARKKFHNKKQPKKIDFFSNQLLEI